MACSCLGKAVQIRLTDVHFVYLMWKRPIENINIRGGLWSVSPGFDYDYRKLDNTPLNSETEFQVAMI